MLSTTNQVEQSLLLGPIPTGPIPLNASTQKCRSSFRNLIFLPLFWNWSHIIEFAFQCSWSDPNLSCMTRSQVPQPTLRSDFQVSWRIWAAWHVACFYLRSMPADRWRIERGYVFQLPPIHAHCTIVQLVYLYLYLYFLIERRYVFQWCTTIICLPIMHNDMSSNHQHTIMYNCTTVQLISHWERQANISLNYSDNSHQTFGIRFIAAIMYFINFFEDWRTSCMCERVPLVHYLNVQKYKQVVTNRYKK